MNLGDLSRLARHHDADLTMKMNDEGVLDLQIVQPTKELHDKMRAYLSDVGVKWDDDPHPDVSDRISTGHREGLWRWCGETVCIIFAVWNEPSKREATHA